MACHRIIFSVSYWGKQYGPSLTFSSYDGNQTGPPEQPRTKCLLRPCCIKKKIQN